MGKHKRIEELEGAQRAAAMASGNVVVAAGAGTGKTTVLAARYIRLLSEGELDDGSKVHARNVLVLTFTRKAAAEMYSRIYAALIEAAADARGRDAGLAAHLELCVEEFSQAQISTFDSFASRIARSGSARYGLAPDFAVDDEAARKVASRLALEFVLEKRGEEAIRELVSADGFEGAYAGVLADLAVERMSLSSPPDFAAYHAIQAEALDRMLAATADAIRDARLAALEYGAGGASPAARKWLDAFAADPGDPSDAGAMLAFLGRFDGLTRRGLNAANEAAAYLNEAAAPFKLLAERYRSLASAREAHPGRLGIYRLLDEFRLRWDEERRRRKVLAFRDVATMALDLLRDDVELRAHYKRLYRYVMIDEFQDDDELQKRVLFLVAERRDRSEPAEPSPGDLAPDKLFFVGDEKQSIYLFRGADVRVFRGLDAELAAGGGAGSRLALSRNFRAEPGLIDIANRAFSSIMAPEAGAAIAPYEARFELLEPRPATPGVAARLEYLELARAEEDEGLAPRAECEAWEVARYIRDAVASGTYLVADHGAARPARYEDFAILLRSTGNQLHFEKYLRLLGLPYAADNVCGLLSEAVACDLYYALRLGLRGEPFDGDRNALAAYLRSPLAGLSDEGTAAILLGEAAPFSEESGRLLAGADRAAWRRGGETLRGLERLVDRVPAARCLSYLWYERGYRVALLRDRLASAFEEHFEILHLLAVQADERGERMASFLASLEPSIGSPEKLEADTPREGSRGVRIMTIHKAKGLEFPVVILPQANNAGQDREASESWFWEDRLGPTFRLPEGGAGARAKANPFYEEAREERAAMRKAEVKRLLYVALTRAESRILVTAVAPSRRDLAGTSFRSLLGSALGLFSLPSPLAPPPEGATPGGAAEGGGSGLPLGVDAGGELEDIGGGVFVGAIPDRAKAEYLALLSAAGAGKAPIEAAARSIGRITRRAPPEAAAVKALSEAYAAASGGRRAAEALEAPPSLEAPEGVAPEDWGSLVHAVLEAELGEARSRRPDAELEASYLGSIDSARARRAALSGARELARAFLDSELGRRARASTTRYTEWELAVGYEAGGRPGERRVARGTVDLAFVEGGRAVVVDYKTDRSIEPGRYDLQVATYRRAASEILGIPAEAWIFYLYAGRAVAVDADGRAPGLADAPEAPDKPLDFGFGLRGY